MALEAATAAVADTGTRIGRHFSIVGVLPSLCFIGYVYLLVAGGALEEEFRLSMIADRIDDLRVSSAVLLSFIAVLFSIVLHPFQYALTQILEGYWGSTKPAVRAATWRISAHRDRFDAARTALQREQDALLERAVRNPDKVRASGDAQRIWRVITSNIEVRFDAEAIRRYTHYEAEARNLAAYPQRRYRLMPTRLGNALRGFEDHAGEQYGLQIIPIAQHLHFVALPEHRAYAADTKQQLDLTVRVCALSLLAVPVTALLLADNGWWVLLAFAAYLVAYVSYRGTISAAHAYGSAVSAVLDANRFRLYEQLHLKLPDHTGEERVQNQRLITLLRGAVAAHETSLRYAHPSRPDPS